MHHRRSALRLGFCDKENGKDRRLARETRSAAAEVEKSHRLPSAFPLLRPCIMQRAEVGGGSGRILKIPFSIPSPFPPFPPSPSLFFLSYRLRWWRGGGKRGEGGLATIGKGEEGEGRSSSSSSSPLPPPSLAQEQFFKKKVEREEKSPPLEFELDPGNGRSEGEDRQKTRERRGKRKRG